MAPSCDDSDPGGGARRRGVGCLLVGGSISSRLCAASIGRPVVPRNWLEERTEGEVVWATSHLATQSPPIFWRKFPVFEELTGNFAKLTGNLYFFEPRLAPN
jgi:hypothetical protein